MESGYPKEPAAESLMQDEDGRELIKATNIARCLNPDDAETPKYAATAELMLQVPEKLLRQLQQNPRRTPPKTRDRRQTDVKPKSPCRGLQGEWQEKAWKG